MNHDTTSDGADRAVVIESQLDWLTAGYDAGPSADRAEAWAIARQAAEARAGERSLPFALMGFQGTTVGRVRFGRRGQLALLQLSGDLAERHADDVFGTADRISRLDLAVTVRLPHPDQFLGESTYAQACNHRAEHPAAALPWIVQDDDGGCTAYIGKRGGDRFLRVYNKEAECKARQDENERLHYERCWRYELQLGGKTASRTLDKLYGVINRADTIAGWMVTYCANHGVAAVIPGVVPGELVPGFRRRSDRETRMRWLTNAVAPAILNLLPEVDREDILEALGLGDGRPTDRRSGDMP
jgi:DNA relaxase NicK